MPEKIEGGWGQPPQESEKKHFSLWDYELWSSSYKTPEKEQKKETFELIFKGPEKIVKGNTYTVKILNEVYVRTIEEVLEHTRRGQDKKTGKKVTIREPFLHKMRETIAVLADVERKYEDPEEKGKIITEITSLVMGSHSGVRTGIVIKDETMKSECEKLGIKVEVGDIHFTTDIYRPFYREKLLPKIFPDIQESIQKHDQSAEKDFDDYDWINPIGEPTVTVEE